jgi:hypothetical protein
MAKRAQDDQVARELRRDLLRDVHRQIGGNMWAEGQMTLPRYIALLSLLVTMVLNTVATSTWLEPLAICMFAMVVLGILYIVDWHQRAIQKRKAFWQGEIRVLLVNPNPPPDEMDDWLFSKALPFAPDPDDDERTRDEKRRKRYEYLGKTWSPGLDGWLIYGLSFGVILLMLLIGAVRMFLHTLK